MQEHILSLLQLVPDDRLDWSPKPELWNFRGILLHIADTRDRWLTEPVRDGGDYPNIWTFARTKEQLDTELRRTYDRVQRFARDTSQLGRRFSADELGEPEARAGHWIAFHLLEHDIHHRADLMHYLALLDIPSGIDL